MARATARSETIVTCGIERAAVQFQGSFRRAAMGGYGIVVATDVGPGAPTDV